jgi:ribosome biogenesis GTPase A
MLLVRMNYTDPHEDKNDNEILDRINWLPGHMITATKAIKRSLKLVDIIVEVRDARVPLASGNKLIYDKSADTPHLVVFNKTNLASPETVKLWEKWFTEQKESFIFINAMDKSSIKTIVKRMREILQAHRVSSNATASTNKEVAMMILGLPNTGKSTIINKLSNRNATKAAATPGQTKVNLWIKVDKGLKILDTPGVMPPRIDKQVHAMWLSAIHAIPDHIITPEYSAEFIVEHLLKNRSQAFQDHYKFESLDIDFVTVLDHIGKRRGCLIAGGGYDYEHVYKIILGDFRKGALGLTTFELPPVK